MMASWGPFGEPPQDGGRSRRATGPSGRVTLHHRCRLDHAESAATHLQRRGRAIRNHRRLAPQRRVTGTRAVSGRLVAGVVAHARGVESVDRRQVLAALTLSAIVAVEELCAGDGDGLVTSSSPAKATRDGLTVSPPDQRPSTPSSAFPFRRPSRDGCGGGRSSRMTPERHRGERTPAQAGCSGRRLHRVGGAVRQSAIPPGPVPHERAAGGRALTEARCAPRD
jgi:hypothetical protein